MFHNDEFTSQNQTAFAKRPQVISYDSGYEHSIEHLIEVRHLVEESAEETTVIAEARELVGMA
jgi:hypothetical protein